MTRRLGCGAASAVLALAVVLATCGPAAADTPTPVTTGATAASTPLSTGAGRLQPRLTDNGAIAQLLRALGLGGLLDSFDDLVSNAIDAVQPDLDTLLDSALGTTGPFHAATPADQGGPEPAAFPGDSFPSGCTANSTTQPCYSLTPSVPSLKPLLDLGLGAVHGYTQQVPAATDASNPIFARSQVAQAHLAVLPGLSSIPGVPGFGNPVVSTGVVDAKATCPNDVPSGGTAPATRPSAQVSATGVSLLGGLVTFDVADDQITDLTVNGSKYTFANLPVLSVAGVTVQTFDTALMITLPLDAGALLRNVGLGAVGTLLDMLGSSTLKLSLVVGPGTATTSTSAQAWGLGVGADLSGAIHFDLAGLLEPTLTFPSGIGQGNLGNVADIRLAYAGCGSGAGSQPAPTASAVVPPALI